MQLSAIPLSKGLSSEELHKGSVVMQKKDVLPLSAACLKSWQLNVNSWEYCPFSRQLLTFEFQFLVIEKNETVMNF